MEHFHQNLRLQSQPQYQSKETANKVIQRFYLALDCYISPKFVVLHKLHMLMAQNFKIEEVRSEK